MTPEQIRADRDAGTLKIRINPPDTAPNGCPVLVAGGIAMRKTGGEWFSGMCEPAFSRRLNWEPKWWAVIPQKNEMPDNELEDAYLALTDRVAQLAAALAAIESQGGLAETYDPVVSRLAYINKNG